MKNIFNFSLHSTHRKHDISVYSRNTINYDGRDLRALGLHTWNSLAENIKSTNSIFVFKTFFKNWFGPKCKRKLCL